MQKNESYNQITFRGIRWLLLFVFYLQFLIPIVLDWKWKKFFAFPIPDYVQMTVIQVFAVLVPCLVFVYLNSASFFEVFKLKKISASYGVMCVLIGVTAQSVATILNVPVLMLISLKTGGIPEKVVQTPESIIGLLTGLVVVALLPAFFEELLMRGIVLSATEEKGYRASLIISGLYFAIIHNQIENFAGHFFLGFLLCYIVWMTQSVWGGIIAHFSFNAFGMIFDYLMNSTEEATASGDAFYWIVTAILSLLFFFFVSTINRKRIRRNKSHKLAVQLLFSILNFPVLLIVLGYILFQMVRFSF